jgi:hypothetical protein
MNDAVANSAVPIDADGALSHRCVVAASKRRRARSNENDDDDASADEDADDDDEEENCRAIPSSSDGASDWDGGDSGVGVSLEIGESHRKSFGPLLLPVLLALFVHDGGIEADATAGSASNTEKLFKCKTPQMRRNVAIGSMAVNLKITQTKNRQ